MGMSPRSGPSGSPRRPAARGGRRSSRGRRPSRGRRGSGAQLRVAAHVGHLLAGQRAGLAKDRVGDTDLADVVQHPASRTRWIRSSLRPSSGPSSRRGGRRSGSASRCSCRAGRAPRRGSGPWRAAPGPRRCACLRPPRGSGDLGAVDDRPVAPERLRRVKRAIGGGERPITSPACAG